MGKYTNCKHSSCKVRENADIRKIALILEKRKRKSHDIGVALRDYLNKQQQAVSKQQYAVSKKEND